MTAATAEDDPQLRASAPAYRQVSFRLQRLEPFVAYCAAGLLAWGAVFLRPGLVAWGAAFFAVAVGAWARAVPARHPAMMFARALLLHVAGAVLLLEGQAGGLDGPAVLWPVAVSVGYALLLPAVWSVPVIVLGLGLYATGWSVADPAPAWQAAGALFGGLWGLPLLALVIGRSLRASEHRMEQSRIDPRTHLYNEAGFFAHGSELFDDCKRRGVPFTLALLRAADLRDASQLLGRQAAAALFEQTVNGIAAATPAGGIAARTDSVEFAVAMPGVPLEKAEALLYQRLGRPPQVQLRVAKAQATIMLDLLAAQAPPELHTLEELYDRVHHKLGEGGQEAQPTQPATTVSGVLSTLQGLLLQDPPMARSQKPTLPMPLPPGMRRRAAAKGR